jgi:hypothetical protein
MMEVGPDLRVGRLRGPLVRQGCRFRGAARRSAPTARGMPRSRLERWRREYFISRKMAMTKSGCQAMRQQFGQLLRQLGQDKPATEILGDCRGVAIDAAWKGI